MIKTAAKSKSKSQIQTRSGSTRLNLTSQLAMFSWFQRLWLLAPIMIWFSYLPRLALGSNATMNFELSLTLIYVAIMGLVGLPTIWRSRRQLARDRLVWLVTGVVAWSGLTVLWSPNQLRGMLTFGVLGLLYLIFLATYAGRAQIKLLLPTLIKMLIGSAVAACLLALLQMVAGTYIQARQSTGLCAGCVAGQFGFVRPNLFAIEPQFFGSLLLAPTLFMLYYLIKHHHRWWHVAIFILLLTMLGLTLSRGAIYAFIVGAIILWLVVKSELITKMWTISLMTISLMLCLVVQGGLATVNPHISETFWGAITKSIGHLTLGVVDLRGATAASPTADSPAVTSPFNSPAGQMQKPVYDGYVAESTNVRVNLSKVALAAWADGDRLHRIFGAGLGSAGKVMAKQVGSSYEKEIVQNEFVEILLERGLIGLLLTVTLIFVIIYRLHRFRWAWSILAAYLIQYCFFSGLPNALHVFLVATLLMAL